MNEKNLDYLSNQLKYTGFGEEMKEQLAEKMQKQDPVFTLGHAKNFGKDETVATLHFRKGDESDMYFFNRYTLLLKNEQHPEPLKQTFYIGHKEDNTTLKEGYNLLSGRAVFKEMKNRNDEIYKAWIQLDFKNQEPSGNFKQKIYGEGYKYDLISTLEKHPIKEMDYTESRKQLIDSLEKGNRQSVTLSIDGKERKVQIEAVPQFKSLNFYESNGQRIRTDKLYAENNTTSTVQQDKGQKQDGSTIQQDRGQKHHAGPAEEEGHFGTKTNKKQKRKNGIH